MVEEERGLGFFAILSYYIYLFFQCSQKISPLFFSLSLISPPFLRTIADSGVH